MSNANANADGNGEPVFTYVKYIKQYLGSEPRQEIDYYVNDWENYKQVANERGDYVEFAEEYVEEGDVKYKKIKRQCPMSEYKKEIDDLNKSSDLNKSNVNENASVNPENNVVLPVELGNKEDEKREGNNNENEVIIKEGKENRNKIIEKKETIEIRVEENKNDAESAKEEKNNNKDEIVKEKSDGINIITEKKDDEKGEIKGNNSESDSSGIINNVDGNEVNKSNNNIVMLTDGNNNDQHLETNNKEKNEKAVNSNESVNPENNVVLPVELGNKEDEKREGNNNENEVIIKEEKENRNEIIEKKETIEIRVEENKNDAESAKGEKDNNKDKIVKKEIIKIKNNESHIITEEKGEEEEIEENNSLKLDKTSITLNKFEIKNSGYQEIIGNLNVDDNKSKNKNGEMPASDTTLDVGLLVKGSRSFTDFCERLAASDKNIDLSKLSFSGVSLHPWNYFRAFFLVLCDMLFGEKKKTEVNYGFRNRMCLRIFYENAKFEGKTYCFEVPKAGNAQSQHSNKAQYEQNIDWLSSQIEKTKEQASKKPPGIDSNSRNLVK